MNFYNAKQSKAGNHVNLTFIDGEGDERRFYHCSIRIGEGKTGCRLKEENGRKYAVIEFPLTAVQTKEAPKPRDPLLDELPF